MVQVIEGGPSRSAMQAQLLGPALGEGIGNAIGIYNANQSLQKVLRDPKLKNAPVSDKLRELESALRPHGQRGQNMLAAQLGIEEQAMQERQQKAFAQGDYSQLPIDQQIKMIQAQNETKAAEQKRDLEERKLQLEYEKLKNQSQKVDDFTKLRNKQKAEKLSAIENAYAQAQGREGVYDQLDTLIDSVSGLKGFVNPFSQEASEFEALSLSAIDAPLKLFNPVGAIPTAKINLIKEKYTPKYWEPKSVQKGKVKALKFINSNALKMGQQLKNLKEIHGDNIPMDDLLNLSNMGAQIVDQLSTLTPGQLENLSNQEQKVLTPELVNDYLRKAGGNPDLAEQMAREDGLTW